MSVIFTQSVMWMQCNCSLIIQKSYQLLCKETTQRVISKQSRVISDVHQSNVNAKNPHLTYQIIGHKWSIWCNIPSPNFPHKILYFLFTSLFIFSLDFCQCKYKTSPHLRIPDQRRKNYVYKHKHKHWKADILLSTRMADSRWHGRARWVLLLWLFQSY